MKTHYNHSVEDEYSLSKLLWNENQDGLDDQLLIQGARLLNLDPSAFEHLESSADEFLSQYLVNFDLPLSIYEDHNILFISPTGGGKTALRSHMIHTCITAFGTAQPLPVSIVPERDTDITDSDIDGIHRFLLEMTARSLFIWLSFHPDKFLELTEDDRLLISHFLDRFLPSYLEHYLTQINDDPTAISTIQRRLDPAYHIVDFPSTVQVQEFRAAMQQSISNSSVKKPLAEDFISIFPQILLLLSTQLGFRSIFFLIDALDNIPFVTSDLLTRWLDSVIQIIEKNGCFIKAFLTDTLAMNLLNSADDHTLFQSENRYMIQWTESRLIEMLQRRVWFASGEQFPSLDALATTDLQRIEEQLVKHIPHKPREALDAIRKLIIAYAERVEGKKLLLSTQDLAAVLTQ